MIAKVVHAAFGKINGRVRIGGMPCPLQGYLMGLPPVPTFVKVTEVRSTCYWSEVLPYVPERADPGMEDFLPFCTAISILTLCSCSGDCDTKSTAQKWIHI